MLSSRSAMLLLGGRHAFSRNFPFCLAFHEMDIQSRESVLLSWKASPVLKPVSPPHLLLPALQHIPRSISHVIRNLHRWGGESGWGVAGDKLWKPSIWSAVRSRGRGAETSLTDCADKNFLESGGPCTTRRSQWSPSQRLCTDKALPPLPCRPSKLSRALSSLSYSLVILGRARIRFGNA